LTRVKERNGQGPAYLISGLVHEYEDRVALAVERLSIDQGAIVGLVGPNGSGKSTLLRILSLVERPTRGSLLFLGREVDYESARHRRSVSMLLQDPYLLKRSVLENVAYGLRIRKDTDNLEARVGEALDWVGLAPDSFTRRSHRALSGGEAQRVALASRLILRPDVLLLDEPTASVDTASARLIREAALRARQEWGTTLVIASHDRSWLEEVADRTVHLFQGRIRESGLVNLLTGPWREKGRGRAAMVPSPGLELFVDRFPGQGAVASIDPQAISVLEREPDEAPGLNILPARILALSLNNGGTGILVRASVGALSLTANLELDQSREMELFPGREVWLAFAPDAPDWL
jgi:tungstate transport system ATP-binding protein